ncbi:hypothetical protein IPC75_14960 [Pseudomonas aeruginosa]|nr:hypothetical protein IPC78_03930 [Pseudomonas aeruginosa]TEP41179.1 hypothetical protein IPC76_10485 [Pseudomonas aeruginosa]TEP47186.1 hypothetical protein IPC75_14960 [Pseudomonas aeruginosa]TEP52447.1 hypothetical protein IPC77_03810 [Pseudomonas aeruginosa]
MQGPGATCPSWEVESLSSSLRWMVAGHATPSGTPSPAVDKRHSVDNRAVKPFWEGASERAGGRL